MVVSLQTPNERATGRCWPCYRRASVVRKRVIAAVGIVIGVAVAASVAVVIEARDETTATTEMRFMGEVAASRGEVLTHTTASESSASTAEMARTEASDAGPAEAADVSGAAEAA